MNISISYNVDLCVWFCGAYDWELTAEIASIQTINDYYALIIDVFYANIWAN